MRGRTHIVGGVACALAVTKITGLFMPEVITSVGEDAILGTYLTAASVGALLPDIDTKQSKVSHQHKVISFFSRLFFTHRGFTHSALCMGLFGAVLCIMRGFIPNEFGNALFWGYFVGYASHLLLDSFNPKGIPLLYPYKLRFSFGKIKTGGIAEILIILLLICICAYLGYDVIGSRIISL